MAQALYETTLKNLPADKKIFVIFGADWCGYCKMFDKYVSVAQVSSILEKAFCVIHVSTDTDEGKQLSDKLKGGETINGIPWFAIVDHEQKVVSSSVPGYGNLGYPLSGQEPDMFINILKQTTTQINEQDLATLKNHLIRY
eukprot:TRINITY_DN16169_c0_g1_i1.p1 TRINITY_DN16169_c0_g1~~TRINITY_DN16169_c0_g1_i1.p1  ORF type:complete len:141 (-),score=20.18 TRINITY_DN16169_c0_g1_i1:17-439(-)